MSQLIEENPSRLHYGVAAVDFDEDGQEELFVCGFGGAENQLLKVKPMRQLLPNWAYAECEHTRTLELMTAFAGDGRHELEKQRIDFLR